MSETLEAKLRKAVKESLGLNCDHWDEDMLVEGVVNVFKNLHNNATMQNKDHEVLKQRYKDLAEHYIALRNLVSQFNNDFYKHVYGNEDPQKENKIGLYEGPKAVEDKSDVKASDNSGKREISSED